MANGCAGNAGKNDMTIIPSACWVMYFKCGNTVRRIRLAYEATVEQYKHYPECLAVFLSVPLPY
jgi:hypothetical protein